MAGRSQPRPQIRRDAVAPRAGGGRASIAVASPQDGRQDIKRIGTDEGSAFEEGEVGGKKLKRRGVGGRRGGMQGDARQRKATQGAGRTNLDHLG